MKAEPIIKRIQRLAIKEHRTFAHQLMAMTELYEKTHNVTGKITRKRRKAKALPMVQPEKSARKKHGNLGKTVSAETREKMRLAAVRRWAKVKAKKKREV